MAVSKHNLWKRQKNGLMKLVRSHSEWLEKRRERKMHELGSKRFGEKSGVRTDTTKSGRTKPVVSTKSVASSTKRTQVGKKV